MSIAAKYSLKQTKDFIGDTSIFKEIEKDIGNGIQIIHGESGTGKTSIANIICKNNNIDALEFNSNFKRSLKSFTTYIDDFLGSVSFNKTKGIIFDEFEVFVQDNIGIYTILDTLSNYATTHPIFICINSFYITKLEKYKKCKLLFYKISLPNKTKITQHCNMIMKQENISISKPKLNGLINTTFPDIRKIINSLFYINSENDVFNHDYTSNFKILHSKQNSLNKKLATAESEIFIQVPIFHENYISMCNEKDISVIADSLSKSDVLHTFVYLNQSYSLSYSVVINGIIIPSYHMNNNVKKIQYGSILSKFSNKKTKDKIFKSTIEQLNILTIDQLKCLNEINVIPKSMRSKIISIYAK